MNLLLIKQISIMVGLMGLILLIVYAFVKGLVNNAFKKTLPEQINTIHNLIGTEQDLLVTFVIKKDGRFELKDFSIHKKEEYIG